MVRLSLGSGRRDYLLTGHSLKTNTVSPRRVPQEKQVRWASVATLALQGPLVNRASQALLEKRGQR